MFKILTIVALGYLLYRVSFGGSALAKAENQDKIADDDPSDFTEYEEVD